MSRNVLEKELPEYRLLTHAISPIGLQHRESHYVEPMFLLLILRLVLPRNWRGRLHATANRSDHDLAKIRWTKRFRTTIEDPTREEKRQRSEAGNEHGKMKKAHRQEYQRYREEQRLVSKPRRGVDFPFVRV